MLLRFHTTWRAPYNFYGNEKRHCRCSLYARTVTVPEWWVIFDDIEYGLPIQIERPIDFGEATSEECANLELTGSEEVERVRGFTIYADTTMLVLGVG